MTITVLYFASLREALDCAGECVELPSDVNTVAGLRAHLAARGNTWQALGGVRNLRFAVNRAMAAPDAPVADGDEVAFFPPVTGG